MDKTTHNAEQQALRALLRELRDDRGLRQVDVAATVGEPQSFVSKYESGERRLDAIELRRVCLALGLTLAEFAVRLEERLGRPS